MSYPAQKGSENRHLLTDEICTRCGKQLDAFISNSSPEFKFKEIHYLEHCVSHLAERIKQLEERLGA